MGWGGASTYGDFTWEYLVCLVSKDFWEFFSAGRENKTAQVETGSCSFGGKKLLTGISRGNA